MANPEQLKRWAAEAAIAEVPPGALIGIGTGTTVAPFIEMLGALPPSARVAGAVPSSKATAARLRAAGVPLVDLDHAPELPLYVDGADEITAGLVMIKGGGGALTREKIVASVSARFVCIADESKLVAALGARPVPIEVLAVGLEVVARAVARLGGQATPRHGFTTDDGNPILDVRGLPLDDPAALELQLDLIPGVIENGLFARRPADLLLLGTSAGVRRFTR